MLGNNNECVIDVSHCEIYNNEKTLCSLCDLGYYLEDYACYKQVNYCEKISKGICSQCYESF